MQSQFKNIRITKRLAAGNMYMPAAVFFINIIPYLFPFLQPRISVFFLFFFPTVAEKTVTASEIALIMYIPCKETSVGRNITSALYCVCHYFLLPCSFKIFAYSLIYSNLYTGWSSASHKGSHFSSSSPTNIPLKHGQS